MRRSLLARLIAERRDAEGLTVRQASKQAGVSYSTLWRTETGKMADARTTVAICRWLGVTVEYAMTGREAKRRRCSECVRNTALLTRVRRILAVASAPGEEGR
jgi:transcriptional regulator with XRE-family HTH domain